MSDMNSQNILSPNKSISNQDNANLYNNDYHLNYINSLVSNLNLTNQNSFHNKSSISNDDKSSFYNDSRQASNNNYLNDISNLSKSNSGNNKNTNNYFYSTSNPDNNNIYLNSNLNYHASNNNNESRYPSNIPFHLLENIESINSNHNNIINNYNNFLSQNNYSNNKYIPIPNLSSITDINKKLEEIKKQNKDRIEGDDSYNEKNSENDDDYSHYDIHESVIMEDDSNEEGNTNEKKNILSYDLTNNSNILLHMNSDEFSNINGVIDVSNKYSNSNINTEELLYKQHMEKIYNVNLINANDFQEAKSRNYKDINPQNYNENVVYQTKNNYFLDNSLTEDDNKEYKNNTEGKNYIPINPNIIPEYKKKELENLAKIETRNMLKNNNLLSNQATSKITNNFYINKNNYFNYYIDNQTPISSEKKNDITTNNDFNKTNMIENNKSINKEINNIPNKKGVSDIQESK